MDINIASLPLPETSSPEQIDRYIAAIETIANSIKTAAETDRARQELEW